MYENHRVPCMFLYCTCSKLNMNISKQMNDKIDSSPVLYNQVESVNPNHRSPTTTMDTTHPKPTNQSPVLLQSPLSLISSFQKKHTTNITRQPANSAMHFPTLSSKQNFTHTHPRLSFCSLGPRWKGKKANWPAGYYNNKWNGNTKCQSARGLLAGQSLVDALRAPEAFSFFRSRKSCFFFPLSLRVMGLFIFSRFRNHCLTRMRLLIVDARVFVLFLSDYISAVIFYCARGFFGLGVRCSSTTVWLLVVLFSDWEVS